MLLHLRSRLSPRPFPVLLLLFAVLLAPACTGPMISEDDSAEPEEEETAPDEVVMADYEDFDVSAYREEPPATDVEIEHDVPARMLSGRGDEGTTQRVQGFRIQVFSSQNKPVADDIAAEAISWLEENSDEAPEGLLRGEEYVQVTYSPPYYRVRIGNFTQRAQAEHALQFLRQEFEDAFIAPDEVVITR